jgi:hypothetical protein
MSETFVCCINGTSMVLSRMRARRLRCLVFKAGCYSHCRSKDVQSDGLGSHTNTVLTSAGHEAAPPWCECKSVVIRRTRWCPISTDRMLLWASKSQVHSRLEDCVVGATCLAGSSTSKALRHFLSVSVLPDSYSTLTWIGAKEVSRSI